jgi:hypothetical protein
VAAAVLLAVGVFVSMEATLAWVACSAAICVVWFAAEASLVPPPLPPADAPSAIVPKAST